MICGKDLGGYLFTFEGPDGSGKTTQLVYLKELFDKLGLSYESVREPGGTRIGERIRDVLHHVEHVEMHPRSELLLYQAARAQLVEEKIRPWLSEGKIVLCDRFFDSTLAYQGYGHGLDIEEVNELVEFATGGLVPDRTIYIDISAEEGLKRRQIDGAAEWNRLDAMGLAFHKKVRDGYLLLAGASPERFVVIDGNREAKLVHADIIDIVVPELSRLGFIEGPISGKERR